MNINGTVKYFTRPQNHMTTHTLKIVFIVGLLTTSCSIISKKIKLTGRHFEKVVLIEKDDYKIYLNANTFLANIKDSVKHKETAEKIVEADTLVLELFKDWENPSAPRPNESLFNSYFKTLKLGDAHVFDKDNLEINKLKYKWKRNKCLGLFKTIFSSGRDIQINNISLASRKVKKIATCY